MPWAPAKKEFQEAYAPAEAVQVQKPFEVPNVVDHDVETTKMPPEVIRNVENSYMTMPVWKANAFTFDGDYNATALTSRRLEELLALAYLKSVRRTVVSTGLSYLASFSGRHRCLAAGDNVLTSDGTWKRVEDIKVGDTVFSPQHNGTVSISTVIATHSHFEDEVYDVVEPKLGNARLYTCSKDHKIPLIGVLNLRINKLGEKELRKQIRDYREYTAEHISKIKRAAYSRVVTFSTPPIDFKLPDAKIDPYCLGVWIGDGHCSITLGKTVTRLSPSTAHGLGITTSDQEIVDEFTRAYPGEINSIYQKQKTNAVTIRITTATTATYCTAGKFFIELKHLGLIGAKSGTKFIPKECMVSSILYRMKLLAGLIDTDGYVPKNNGTIEITTKSDKLARDMLDLVCSLGGYGRITKIKKQIKSIGFEGEYFCVRFAFKAETLLADLANEVHVKRKKERLLKQIERYKTTNRNHKGYDPRHVSIMCVRTNPQMVYGFTLESESGLFITNNWLVTHNSGKSVTASIWAHLWDTTFLKYFETRIVQSPQDFVRAMEIVIKDNTKGAAFVIDEAGATMASTDWYEKWIRALTKTLQICGMLKPMILFVAPNRDFIVSGMRKLIIAEHYLERTHTDYTTIKAYHVKYSTIKHNYYYKKPMVRIADTTYQLNRIHQHQPPEWFLERYKNHTEPKKVDMMSAFSDVVKSSVADKDQDAEPDYETIIRDVFQKKEIFFGRNTKEGYPTIDQAALEIHYKLRPKFSKYVKDRVERLIRENVEEKREHEEILGGRVAKRFEAQEITNNKQRLAALRSMSATSDDDVLRQTGVETMKEFRNKTKEKEKSEQERMDEELKDVLSSLS
jgi:hypothetical protein